MEDKLALSKEIFEFLLVHGKRSAAEPDEWNSPDGFEMESAAHALAIGLPVRIPYSDWSSGGYKPIFDQKAKTWHDDLIDKIRKITK